MLTIWSILSEIRGETTVMLCFLLFQYTLPNTYPWVSYTISHNTCEHSFKTPYRKMNQKYSFLNGCSFACGALLWDHGNDTMTHVSRSIHLGIHALPRPQYSIEVPVTSRYCWRCIMVWTWRPAEKNILEVIYCHSFQFESKNPGKMEHIPQYPPLPYSSLVSSACIASP